MARNGMGMNMKDDAKSTWSQLESGVDRIMTQLQKGMDMKMYMSLYTAIHNFCTAQKAVGSGSFSNNQRSATGGGAHLLGEDLYNHLINYLRGHLAGVLERSKAHSDEALLHYYISEWNRYTTAATYNNHLFRYLNRHWVKREMDEGKKNVYDIYTLHLVRWKEDMFNHTHKEVMKAVLRLVEKQRNGETIEQSQIKQIVNSFVSLGLDESDSTKSTLDVYREYFEKPFLAATKAYYEQESKVFLAENSVVEYMKKAELRLDEEKDRVSLYLLNEITQPLMRTCEEALIADHSLLLRDEFQSLLDNDRQEDLGRMYKLLARIPDGLDPLRTRFETHVRKSGLAAIEKTTDKEIMEPKVYVETLLDVHTQYQSLVNMAFNGEAEFVRSLDNACREFVNRNKVCKSGTTKSPELLAKYCDTLLKRSGAKNSEEDDVEKQLTHIMTVFKYIEDKDVFQKFYTRGLARRLVHQLSASDDAETSMISKMKEACGFEYTNKLQRMFQDMQLSKDLNSNYKEWLNTYLDEPENKAVVDTYFQILGTSFWPLTAPNTKFSPPEIISKTYDRFQKFYLTKHQGRKLTWLWQLSKGEVRVNYIKPGKVPLTLQVSAYQTAILLLFNDADTLTYEDIEQGTLLFKEQLEPSVALMVKAKILNIQPEGAKPEKGTTFSLNYGFRTKKMKINLNLAVKSEAKQEVEDTHKTIEEDRKLLLQSAIVRIMKSRKRMKHQLLITETIEQIKNRFMPHVADIKKCIDILLEKEYLERIDSEDLGYLA